MLAGAQWERTENQEYRCTFVAAPDEKILRLEGLPPLTQVWLNGELILESDNLFVEHRVDVQSRLRPQNELVVRAQSLDAALAQKRPRPRWKTRLVDHQQLRWFRTTLLGHIPGWAAQSPLERPWRTIAFADAIDDVAVRTWLDGTTGVVAFSCASEANESSVRIGEVSTELRREGAQLVAEVRIANAALWWPHTHGTPALYACTVTVDGKEVDCGRIGFRTVEAIQTDGDFELRVNGVPMFCRGACWTPGDPAVLELLRDAGANMVRIGGTMLYESDEFYARCDELGILVWQDFMFANMDYPVDDGAFIDSVRREVMRQLQRLRRHPSVAVYCGNSEVEQQAAMLGMPRELWRNRLFGEVLPALCEGEVYVPSSPSGGTLPFHTGTGVTHYYGVGAYRRPIADARRANVRFTTECLGFANVPEQEVVDEVMGGDSFAMHDPRWKRGTPRDTGSPWDFEDVRDHYLQELFGVDAVALRASDPQHYLALSRVVTGEVMAQVYSEWRSTRSTCRGALVWFLRDLQPGAGWGVLDNRGAPKACFHYLRRVWQPRVVVITDEGLDGLHAHVVNDMDTSLRGTLEWTLLRDGHIAIAQASASVHVTAHGRALFEAEAMLGAFYDTAYAYRFGPPKHDVAIATLLDEQGSVISEAFHFPLRKEPQRAIGANVRAQASQDGDQWQVSIESDHFLYAAHFDANGFAASDDYFHLPPGRKKTITLRGNAKFNASLNALNLDEAVRIQVSP